VACAQEAGQPHAVTLPDRQGGQRPGAVVDGAECGERDGHPAVGGPGVPGLRGLQRVGVGLLGAGPLLGERGDRGVEPAQHVSHAGELDVDEVADRRAARGPGADGDLLVGDADRADPAHRPGVGDQRAGEHLNQGGLAPAVLPDDAEPVAGRYGEVDTGQYGPPAARDVQAGCREVGPRSGREVDDGGHGSSENGPPAASTIGLGWAGGIRELCGQVEHATAARIP
jgi:hypothetical protein